MNAPANERGHKRAKGAKKPRRPDAASLGNDSGMTQMTHATRIGSAEWGHSGDIDYLTTCQAQGAPKWQKKHRTSS
jgi:hypothetical protein